MANFPTININPKLRILDQSDDLAVILLSIGDTKAGTLAFPLVDREEFSSPRQLCEAAYLSLLKGDIDLDDLAEPEPAETEEEAAAAAAEEAEKLEAEEKAAAEKLEAASEAAAAAEEAAAAAEKAAAEEKPAPKSK